MSLLMEALRKAEEAKSKAAKQKKDSGGVDEAPSSSNESPAVDARVEHNTGRPGNGPDALDSERDIPELQPVDQAPVEDEGFGQPSKELQDLDSRPVLINPDPDEEETLASHYSDAQSDWETDSPAKQGEEVRSVEDDLEKIEFPGDLKNKDKPNNQDSLLSSDNDDSLSLLESSYFTRTQKPGGPNFANIDLDDSELGEFDDLGEPGEHGESGESGELDRTDRVTHASGDLESDYARHTPPASNLDAHDFPPGNQDRVTTTQPADHKSIHADTPPSATTPSTKENHDKRSPAAGTGETDEKEQAKRLDQENRDSASALFLAKEASQQNKASKYRSIAAGLLIIPVAGIFYWFYSSINSTPQMQFNVPVQSGLENREFLDNGDNLNTEIADQAPQNTAPLIEQIEQNTEIVINNNLATETTSNTATAPVNINVTAQSGQLSAAAENTNEIDPLPETAPTSPAEQQVSQAAAVVSPTRQETASLVQPDQQVAQNTTPASNAASNTPQAVRAQSGNTNGLNFVRTEVTVTINPDLNAAYDSYQQGDFSAAGRLYQQVLNREPNNRDALLGLASVYSNQNNISLSLNLYARLLELNPRDPLAMAGFLEISVRDDPVRQESELKSLVNAYPGIAPLSFALGNLYASQNRWTEAQNAYFDALLSAKSADIGAISPDYAFNLAVSLERVNQLPVALSYYKEAEEFARYAAPGFNPALLRQRLDYLEQRLQ